MGRMGVSGVTGDPRIPVLDGRVDDHGFGEWGTQEEKRMGKRSLIQV